MACEWFSGLLVVLEREIGEVLGVLLGEADCFVNAVGEDSCGEDESDDGEDVGPGGVVESFKKGAHDFSGWVVGIMWKVR